MDWDATTGATNAAAMKSASIKLEAGKKYFIMTLNKEGGGGDSIGVAWQGPGITARTLMAAKYVDIFYLPPLTAFGPVPANGAVDVTQAPDLTWIAGDKAQKHEVYFGEDKAAVAAADTKSPLYKASRPAPASIRAFWSGARPTTGESMRSTPAEADSPWKGTVWSFTTANFIVVDDFESYTTIRRQGRIFQTWIDGGNRPAIRATPPVGNVQCPVCREDHRPERHAVHAAGLQQRQDAVLL